jgi:hypothetical protein
MALTIEDGTIVAGADSLATIEELVDYSINFGVTIPDDDVDLEAILRRAYLQMTAMQWKGCAVSADQTGPFPRTGIYRNGFILDSTTIPEQAKLGQMALAAEIYADDLDPPEDRSGAIKSETVGPLSTTYADAPNYKARPAASRRSAAHFAGLVVASNQIRIKRA